jgi:hypothetical protein
VNWDTYRCCGNGTSRAPVVAQQVLPVVRRRLEHRRGARPRDGRGGADEHACRDLVKQSLLRKDEGVLFEMANKFNLCHRKADQQTDYDAELSCVDIGAAARNVSSSPTGMFTLSRTRQESRPTRRQRDPGRSHRAVKPHGGASRYGSHPSWAGRPLRSPELAQRRRPCPDRMINGEPSTFAAQLSRGTSGATDTLNWRYGGLEVPHPRSACPPRLGCGPRVMGEHLRQVGARRGLCLHASRTGSIPIKR